MRKSSKQTSRVLPESHTLYQISLNAPALQRYQFLPGTNYAVGTL